MSEIKQPQDAVLVSEVFKWLQPAIPKQWQKVFFYMISADSSYTMKYYVRDDQGKLTDCFQLEKQFPKKLDRRFFGIYRLLNDGLKRLPEDKRWTSILISVNADGQFKVSYGYEKIESMRKKETALKNQILEKLSSDSIPKKDENLTQKMADIQAALLSAREELGQASEAFNEAVLKTMDLDKTFSGQHYDAGLIRICRIAEKLKRLVADDANILAEELTDILKTDFSLMEIKPCKGDAFDAKEHERKNGLQSGNCILCCAMPGWKTRDRILIRAIVETE